MDAIKGIVEAMERAGKPADEINSTAAAMLDLLNFKVWKETRGDGASLGEITYAVG